MTAPACRFNGNTRMIRHHHVKDCNASGCEGCQPCEERHCSMPNCLGEHLNPSENQACAKCVGRVRSDVGMIVGHCQSEAIVEELLERGPRSMAAWLLTPTADVDVWHRREELTLAAAVTGDKAALGWLKDNRHEYHPMWVLGCWDLLIRRYYGHDHAPADLDRDGRTTIAAAAAYITGHLTELARDPGIDFAVIARDMHQTRTMLEHVLPITDWPQRGAPCPTCEEPLVKEYDLEDLSGKSDRWHCKTCGTWRSDKDYKKFTETQHLAHADVLTASQIKAQYGIPEGTVRRWAAATFDTDGKETAPAKVRKRGQNDLGLQLYDVGEVKAQIERRTTTTKESA